MKQILLSLMVVAAIGLSGGCASNSEPPGPTDEEMVAAANELDQRFTVAINSGDIEGLSACYWSSPDAISHLPGVMVVRGHVEIRAGLEEMMAIPGLTMELMDTHNFPLGNAVAGYGLWKMTMDGPDGEKIEMDGRYTDIKAEKDGQWVYIMDHVSVPMIVEEEG